MAHQVKAESNSRPLEAKLAPTLPHETEKLTPRLCPGHFSSNVSTQLPESERRLDPNRFRSGSDDGGDGVDLQRLRLDMLQAGSVVSPRGGGGELETSFRTPPPSSDRHIAPCGALTPANLHAHNIAIEDMSSIWSGPSPGYFYIAALTNVNLSLHSGKVDYDLSCPSESDGALGVKGVKGREWSVLVGSIRAATWATAFAVIVRVRLLGGTGCCRRR